MPGETSSQNSTSESDALPEDVVQSIAVSNAMSIGEQPAILANLALANQIFSASLAQQNAIINQQVVFQVELAALAKCLQVLLAVNISEPQAIENITTRILEMFDQFHSKVEERLSASQNQISQLMNEMRAHAVTDKPETS
jgi:hypothetical protein